jgi:Sulfatase
MNKAIPARCATDPDDQAMTVPARSALYDRRAEWSAHERGFAARGGARPERPNIVFILGDDLGWGDLGVYGSLHHRTPRIDTLARDGVRFTHAYSTSATCSPTRLGLYTGRYPGRLVAGLEEPLRTRDEQHGIPHDHPTLPSLVARGRLSDRDVRQVALRLAAVVLADQGGL